MELCDRPWPGLYKNFLSHQKDWLVRDLLSTSTNHSRFPLSPKLGKICLGFTGLLHYLPNYQAFFFTWKLWNVNAMKLHLLRRSVWLGFVWTSSNVQPHPTPFPAHLHLWMLLQPVQTWPAGSLEGPEAPPGSWTLFCKGNKFRSLFW